MKSPIVIVEDGDISVHPSPEHAEVFLEPSDVKDSNYIGYDSEGNLLDLSVVPAEKHHSLLFFNNEIYPLDTLIHQRENTR